jgi:hypothetical protein
MCEKIETVKPYFEGLGGFRIRHLLSGRKAELLPVSRGRSGLWTVCARVG